MCVRDVVAQLGHERVARLVAGAQDHERGDGLAGRVVGLADDRGLGDRGVRHERGLDLGGGDVVAGDEHDVVDPAEQPVVALGVALGAVAGEVPAREPRPVRLAVALRVAPDPAQHRRPRSGEREVATAGDRRPASPSSFTISAPMPGQRERRAARLGDGRARERADHDGAGLGLPPRVDHRAAAAADVLRSTRPRPRG